MARSRVLKAIHVIGYVTTLILVLELAGIGLWWSYWTYWGPTASRLRESSRTHDRGLRTNDILEADAVKSLGGIRGVPGEGANSVAFVSMPSFSSWHSVSIRLPRGAATASGWIVRVEHDDRARTVTASRAQTFAVPRAAYLEAARRLDVLTDGWAGSVERCYDGVAVAFERVRSLRVTSGVGDASCDHHYANVSQVMESLVSRFAPKAAASAPAASSSPAIDLGPRRSSGS